MKKLPWLALLLFFFLSKPALANYQTARADYVYQYSLYRQAIDTYQVSKSTYLTYKTLTAQNDAEVSLRTAIQARDRLISSYYNLLQEKLNATPGVSPSYLQTYNTIKENEKTWLTNHQKKIDAAASLDDLNKASHDFEGHYPQTDAETKQAVGTVLLTKEANLRKSLDIAITSLNTKLDMIRQSGEDTTLWDRNLITTKNKLDLYDQKYAQAQTVYFPPDYNGGQLDTTTAQPRLIEANQYLREATQFLREIIRSITGQ